MRTKHVLAPAEARRLMKVAVPEAKRLKLEVGNHGERRDRPLLDLTA
jgi:hypothetical protein